jgi:hypothetical protein
LRHTPRNLITIFEDGSKHKGDFREAMKRDGLPEPIFRKKEELIPLQTADLFAWETFRVVNLGERKKTLRFEELRPTVQRINKKQGMKGQYIWARENLEEICKHPRANVPLERDLSPDIGIVHHSSPKRIRRKTIK